MAYLDVGKTFLEIDIQDSTFEKNVLVCNPEKIGSEIEKKVGLLDFFCYLKKEEATWPRLFYIATLKSMWHKKTDLINTFEM